MSERVIATGSDFMAFVRAGTEGAYTYKAIAGQTAVTLQRGANYRETNNKNLGGWKDFFQGLKDWTASVEMDIPAYTDTNTSEINFEDLQLLEEAATKTMFVFCWITNMSDTDENPVPDLTKPYYSGIGLVNCPLNTPPGENATTSIAIQGCRRLYANMPT